MSSSGKSARQIVDIGVQSGQSTTAMFVKNHANPEQLFRQIQGLHKSGQSIEAQRVIECIIDNYHPLVESAEFFVLHAEILFETTGAGSATQAALQQALLIEPTCTSANALQKILNCQNELRDGLYEKGEASLRQLLKEEPYSGYAASVLAHHLLWKNGPESEAVQLFEYCLNLQPYFLKAQLGLALAYKKTRDMTKADGAFKKCLELDTNIENQAFYKKHLQNL
jgi:tetratricopeptide (TPR) repeat protein